MSDLEVIEAVPAIIDDVREAIAIAQKAVASAIKLAADLPIVDNNKCFSAVIDYLGDASKDLSLAKGYAGKAHLTANDD